MDNIQEVKLQKQEVSDKLRRNGAKYLGLQQSQSGRSLRQLTSRKLLLEKNKEKQQKEDKQKEGGVAVKAIQKIRKLLPVSLEWIDLSYSVQVGKMKKSQKQILKSVSGMAAQNRFLAIMGPSGCGKTSLLNSLAGRLPLGGVLQGQILANGIPVNDEFRNLCAYVQQEDLTYPLLTVRETFQVTANLRISSKTSRKIRMEVVEDVITELGLKQAADTYVGSALVRGVSGGERKRTSIGIELIENPSVLFLDEPTTGLDSFQAQSVVSTLWALARNGRTVLSVIHQPRSTIFAMFDQLILLASGRPIYFGDAGSAQTYFESVGFKCPPNFNPSDLFMDIISYDVRSKSNMATSQERIDLFIGIYDKKYQTYQGQYGDKQKMYSSKLISDGNNYNNGNGINQDSNSTDPYKIGTKDKDIDKDKETNGKDINNNGNNGNHDVNEDSTSDSVKSEETDIYESGPDFGVYNPNNMKDKSFDKSLQDQTRSALTSAHKLERANVVSQFFTLLVREGKLNVRDLGPYKSQLYVQIFQGIIFGLTYLKVGLKKDQTNRSNLAGLLYVMSIQATVQTTNAVISSFPRERSIMDRERATKSYNVFPYLMSKFMVAVPIRTIGAIILGILIYLLAYLGRTGSQFFYFIAIIGILSCTAQAVGYFIGSMFKSAPTATIVSQPIVIIFVLFSSFYINENSYPRGSGWVRYISYTRFAFMGFLYNEVIDETGYDCSGDFAQQGGVSCGSCIPDGQTLLNNFGFLNAVHEFKSRPRAYPVIGLTYIFFGAFILVYIVIEFIVKPRFLSITKSKEKKPKKQGISSIKLSNGH